MNKQQLAAKIWKAANEMRSKIEANEYKDYILGFIFYKFLSENEERYFRKMEATKEDIVDIKILEKFSFVEVKKGLEQNILSLKTLKFNGRKINVEVAGEKSKSSNKPKSKGQVNNSKKSGNFNNKKGNKSDKSRGNGKKGSNSSRSKNK